jgi:peptidoglycan-associated lipoprotein
MAGAYQPDTVRLLTLTCRGGNGPGAIPRPCRPPAIGRKPETMSHTKLFGALAAVALLAACETPGEQTAAATGAGAAGALVGPGGVAARPGSQEDLVANVGDRVFFDFDSSVIRPDQRPTLERQARWMQQHPQVAVVVEGHADERGTREYNLALGQRRANSARDVLVANGVAGTRISTISYGKDRPAALGSNEEAWAQNRRAVTVVR